jgi:beta-barrel assembly-enhancing protease
MHPSVFSRRDFIMLTGLTVAGMALGCAVNPVTGQSQLMLMSEADEIQLDHQAAPFQISADYGLVQDASLAAYVRGVGMRLAAVTQRPQMPYAFRPVNAVYVNAYAFPGGTIAATRGILLKLNNEAELAALLGHELGHVNSRHAAQQASKGMIVQGLLGSVALIAGTVSQGLGDIASQMGMIGSGILLASYSREAERQADSLSMDYAVKAGYSPDGCIGLMQMLNGLSKSSSGAVELLFATHPMSEDRLQAMIAEASQKYPSARKNSLYRERYMDATAALRRLQPAIEAFQKAEEELGKKQYGAAESLLRRGLATAPDDYAGLLIMAKCQFTQERYGEAQRYAQQAKQAYPSEAQAHQVSAYACMKQKKFDMAYQDISTVERLLPGNPDNAFTKGYCLEQMGRKPDAAREYQRYLQKVQQGDKARYAYQRLVQWGYASG